MPAPVRFILTAMVIASALMGFAIVIAVHKAHSHSFYPMECCSSQDCAPARVEIIPATSISAFAPGPALPSMMLVSTVHGSVIMPQDFKFRESPDGSAHACMMRNSTTGQMRLICLFLPQAS